jgi:hypothetical protein
MGNVEVARKYLILKRMREDWVKGVSGDGVDPREYEERENTPPA